MKHFTLIRLAKFFLCIILLSPVLQSQLASSTPKNPNDTVGVGTTAPKPKPKPKPQGQGKSGKSDGAKKAMDMMKKLQQLAGQGQKSQKAQDQAKLKSAASDSLKGKDSNELGKHYTLVENQFKAKYLMLSQKKMAIFKKFEAGLKEQLKEQKDATKKLEDLTKKIKKAQKELKNTGKSAKESSDELQQALQFQSTSMGCDNSSKKCKFWDMYKPYKKQLLNKINKAQRAITKVHKPIQLSNDSVDKSYKHHKEKINKKIKDFARKGHVGLQDHGLPVWYRNIRIMELQSRPRPEPSFTLTPDDLGMVLKDPQGRVVFRYMTKKPADSAEPYLFVSFSIWRRDRRTSIPGFRW